jgi:hypothetical protein
VRRSLRTRRRRPRRSWLAAPASNPTADDVAAHLSEASATEPFTVPMSIIDEVAGIATRLGIMG